MVCNGDHVAVIVEALDGRLANEIWRELDPGLRIALAVGRVPNPVPVEVLDHS